MSSSPKLNWSTSTQRKNYPTGKKNQPIAKSAAVTSMARRGANMLSAFFSRNAKPILLTANILVQAGIQVAIKQASPTNNSKGSSGTTAIPKEGSSTNTTHTEAPPKQGFFFNPTNTTTSYNNNAPATELDHAQPEKKISSLVNLSGRSA